MSRTNASTVAWGDIIAQCGNYKAGFVATFRQYEGMATDERTAQGHVVKVTVASFCEHMGISRQTFNDWIRMAEVPEFGTSEAKAARTAASHANVVKNMARNNPDAIVEAIMQAPDSTRDRIYDEVRLRRAGIDTSLSNRKAAEAWANETVEPITRGLGRMRGEMARVTCAAMLDEATDDLRALIDTGTLTSEVMDEIAEAYERFALTLAEARLAVS